MKRALLLSKVDREDYWVNGFAFVVDEHAHYKEDFASIRACLSSEEFVKALIAKFWLEEDLFNGDKTFKFSGVRYDYRVIFTFENQYGETVDFSLRPDHIDVIDEYGQ